MITNEPFYLIPESKISELLSSVGTLSDLELKRKIAELRDTHILQVRAPSAAAAPPTTTPTFKAENGPATGSTATSAGAPAVSLEPTFLSKTNQEPPVTESVAKAPTYSAVSAPVSAGARAVTATVVEPRHVAVAPKKVTHITPAPQYSQYSDTDVAKAFEKFDTEISQFHYNSKAVSEMFAVYDTLYTSISMLEVENPSLIAELSDKFAQFIVFGRCYEQGLQNNALSGSFKALSNDYKALLETWRDHKAERLYGSSKASA